MRSARVAALLLPFCVAVLEPASAAPRSVVDRFYDCRVIARSTEFPPAPGGSMSASGTVAFLAPSAGGIEEIRLGRGDLDGQGVPISHAIARMGGNGTFSQFFSPPSINDSGQVAFLAADEDGLVGLWVLSPSHVPTIASPRYDPGGSFTGAVGSGQINASGVPLFVGSFGTSPQRTGLFRGPGASTPRKTRSTPPTSPVVGP